MSEFFFGTFFEVSGKSHSAKKCKRGEALGFLNIHSVAKYQKLGANWGTKKFSGKYQSHSAEKKESLSGPFCFGMAFYLMLEALDALKMKY